MKQVNRNFLEEQVKKALNEQEEEMSGQELAADIILGLPFGSPSSYKTLSNYLSDIGMYGFGPDKFYKKVLAELGNIEKKGARAPFTQLMLRFYNTAPVTGDSDNLFDPETLNLMPNEELARELADVKKYGYSKILPVLKTERLVGGESKVFKIENVLRVMAHRNTLSTLDESLEDIAISYGFMESDLSYFIRNPSGIMPWGSETKITPVTLFKEPQALESAGMYTEFAKDIIKAGPSKLSDSLEKFIMFHFNGLEDANFRKAMFRLQARSNLQNVAKAHIAYEKASSEGLEAVLALADITLSTASTAAAAVAFLASSPIGGSAAVPVGLGLKMAKKVGLNTARDFLIKKTGSNIAKRAAALHDTKKYKYTIGLLDSTLAQLSGHFGPYAASWSYNKWLDLSNDIEEKNKAFFQNYADKPEQERITFFEEEIRPSLEHIGKRHREALEAAQFDTQFMTTRVADINKIRGAYASFNKDYILNLQNNILETGKNIESTVAAVKKIVGDKDKAKEAQAKIEAANQSAEEALNAPTPKLPIASAFQQSGLMGAEDKEETEPESDVTQDTSGQEISSSDLFFVGDSIAQGLKDASSGAEGVTHIGKTSDYVLKQLQGHFDQNSVANTIKEAQSGKTAIVSVGTNDAFGAGVGGNYTPEKTLNNIKNIVKLLKKRGYDNVKVMPLMHDAKKGRTKLYGRNFDQEKHRKFVEEVNSGLVTAGISTFDNSVTLSNDGIHPKSYKDLLNKALDGGAVVKPGKMPSGDGVVQKPTQKTKVSGKAATYWPMVRTLSKEEGVDPALVMGIIFAESGFNPRAVSRAGAQGLMQLMPSVQKQFGVIDVFDPEQNIRAGIKTFKTIKDKYIPFEMKRANTKIDYDTLSEDQKTRLGLYGYNWGARGIVSKLNMNKYDNIDDFLARVNTWYLSKHGYDYADKIFNYANANGASFSSLPVSSVSKAPIAKGANVAQPAAAEKEEEKFQTNTEGIEQQIKEIANAKSVGSLVYAFNELFDTTLGSIELNTPAMKRAESKLENSDLSSFADNRIKYLQALHANNEIKWKSAYRKEVEAAAGDQKKLDQAEKKIAWMHRPMFYVTVMPNDTMKFFGNSTSISFGFEPGSKKNSVSYRGRQSFYKDDSINNAAFQRFIKDLSLLQKATNTAKDKLLSFEGSVTGREAEALQELKNYLVPMDNIINATISGLTDPGTETIRKAYLVTILDLALRTT